MMVALSSPATAVDDPAGAGRAPVWTSTVTPVPLWASVAGAGIDRPGAGESGDGWALVLAGWVVGHSSPAREVHVLHDGMLVCRTTVEVERDDVAGQFAGSPGADRSGYRVHIGLLGLPPTTQLKVVTVLEDGTTVHLATILVNHRPLATSYQPHLSPITVTSLGRMGTTWLMRLLAHHPDIVVHPQYPYELGMAKYWAHLLRVASGPADHQESSHPETFTAESGRIGHNPYFGDFLSQSPVLHSWLAARSPALIGACAQQSLDEFYGAVAGDRAVRFYAEKSLPDHVPDTLHDLYPDMHELILVRDIRDVICSAIAFDAKRSRRSFGRESLDDDLGFVSQIHMDLGRLVQAWRRRQDTALLVRYETLITEPAHTVGEILGHLGLDRSPRAVAAVLEGASATTPELDGHRTTTDPSSSIGRWRSDLARIHPDLPELCAELFSPLLGELGYSVAVPRARRLGRDLVGVLGQLDGLEPLADG
jgi:hypothetical protein